MNRKLRVSDLVYIALMAALLAVCAWVTIPTPAIAFTLQTMGVFLALIILGGKRGTLAIFVYILLGAVGVPVFSGFKGGLGALLSATGGYIFGFLFTGLAYWLLTALLGQKLPVQIFALVVGLLLCYAVGTAWYLYLSVQQGGAIPLGAALTACVVPFLLPDGLKLALALFLGRRLQPFVK